MESKYHVGTRSTLRCKLKRKQQPPAVGRYLYALTKPRGDAALESGLAAAEGRVLRAEALNLPHVKFATPAYVIGRGERPFYEWTDMDFSEPSQECPLVC